MSHNRLRFAVQHCILFLMLVGAYRTLKRATLQGSHSPALKRSFQLRSEAADLDSLPRSRLRAVTVLHKPCFHAGLYADKLCVQSWTRVAHPPSAQNRRRFATPRKKQDSSTSEKARHLAHGLVREEWLFGIVFCKLFVILKTALFDALLVRAESTARLDFSDR